MEQKLLKVYRKYEKRTDYSIKWKRERTFILEMTRY